MQIANTNIGINTNMNTDMNTNIDPNENENTIGAGLGEVNGCGGWEELAG